MDKIATAGFEIVIITLICVSLLSGRPAFETSGGGAESLPPAELSR